MNSHAVKIRRERSVMERLSTLAPRMAIIIGVFMLVVVLFVGHNSQEELSSGNKGYWDPMTATVDWCEENYAYSYYIAEFWNTISNVFYIIFTFCGMYIQKNLEKRFYLAYLTIATIGLGSSFFHGTLLFYGQLFDELPMLYLMCALYYIVKEHRALIPNRTLGLLLVVGVSIFTVVYLLFPFPTLFQIGWGLFVMYTFYLGSFIVKAAQPDDRNVSTIATFILIFSGSVWVFEQAFCNAIVRSFRLHAMWHLGTAYVAYCTVTSLWLFRCKYVLKRNAHYEWLFHFLPYVSIVEKSLNTDTVCACGRPRPCERCGHV